MQLKVTLKKSTIGQSVVKEANDSIKGQISKVKHLVAVEEI